MFWVVPLLSHKLWATFFLIKKQSVLFSWPRGICAILGVQASGRSIYICLSSSFLFWGLWGVSCYFLSPFPMGHWKDPQIWSPIYFLTWGKITLERALIVLGLCFCVENWELISFSKNVRSILGIAYFRAKHQKWANSDSVPALLGRRAHGPKSLEWVTPRSEQIQTQSLPFWGRELMGQRVWNGWHLVLATAQSCQLSCSSWSQRP